MVSDDVTPGSARPESEIFAELRLLCTSPGYIHAVAYFCWRDNLITYTEDQLTTEDMEHQYSNDRLLRTEISTLIGLMAKGKIDNSIPSPEIFQTYIDRTETLLHEMHLSLQKPWFEGLKNLHEGAEIPQHFDPFSTADGMREPIFYGGESAYNFQYEELALKKYLADNPWLKSHKGFGIDEACQICKALGKLQSEKAIKQSDEIRKLHPDQRTFLPGFVFTAEDLDRRTGVEIPQIKKFLEAFTFDESRRNSSFASLSEFNETNATPILKNGKDSYTLLQHYSLLEALYETPFFWMAGDKAYRKEAAINRGNFAEDFVAERLFSIFGKDHVWKNVDIYKGKQRFAEADILVLYGDRAIVVQAKSKRLTIEARKGNDLQLKDDFKKAIQHAYDQAATCSDALIDHEYKFIGSDGNEVSIGKRPKIIFPLCVVSDHYPALATQARQFLKVKSSSVIHPPIVTDVFFIDVMTEMLSTPLHLLNYFALRAKFDDKLMVNQELTNLGYHLAHNLWLDDQYSFVNLGDDFTAALDIAMMARRHGVPGETTPKGILTRFDSWTLGRLISEIEKTATLELVGLGLLFLQLSSEAAEHITNGIDQLVRAAAHDGKTHDMSVPIDTANAGFTIHVNALPEPIAREKLIAHCKIRKYARKANAWYGLLLSPDNGDIRGALVSEKDWVVDPAMERTLKSWPQKPMTPLSQFSPVKKRKIGRNEPCPCGSGKKHKKCCLNR